MSTFKRHVGRIKNTDRRCVVVYMQIPGNEDNALVVDTDALPDRFHDALMAIIDSNEGQQTPLLHTLLGRRILPDLNMDMMNALHIHGLLRTVEIDNIVMYPAPNAPCPLRTIVDVMNTPTEKHEDIKVELNNRILENQKADASQSQIDIANGMIRQAMDLEAAAAKKREEAYRLVPALRPREVPTNVLADEQTIVDVNAGPDVDCPDVTEASATVTPLDQNPYGYAEALVMQALKESVDSPVVVQEAKEVVEDTTSYLQEETPSKVFLGADDIDPTLPAEVIEALKASISDFNSFEDEEVEGNQVDSSDDAVQAFLDRAAYREDRADREKWEAMQPKKPVGRPRHDGLPAGTKPVAPPAPPKKRGRPPKVKP